MKRLNSVDVNIADSHSARPPGPPSLIVQRSFLASDAQPGLHGVIPSQVRNFALASDSCVPLRSGPVSPGTGNRQKGCSCGFYSYVHYNCSKLLMFSLSEVSKCVKLISPPSRKINYRWGTSWTRPWFQLLCISLIKSTLDGATNNTMWVWLNWNVSENYEIPFK